MDWRWINLVGLNLSGSGTYGDCKVVLWEVKPAVMRQRQPAMLKWISPHDFNVQISTGIPPEAMHGSAIQPARTRASPAGAKAMPHNQPLSACFIALSGMASSFIRINLAGIQECLMVALEVAGAARVKAEAPRPPRSAPRHSADSSTTRCLPPAA